MNFVEIIENERKPRLTGGRRGNATLQPGGTNVNSSLVPVSKLPPSAGSLASVMASLKPKRGKGYSAGIVDKYAVLSDPSKHLTQYVGLVNKSEDAPPPAWTKEDVPVPGENGGKRKRRPRKSAGSAPEDMELTGRLNHGSGRMSKLVPRHGHGAYTQIGTNYQLGQFSAGAIQPIGNLASTLSPALSKGSIGAGLEELEGAGFSLSNVFAGILSVGKSLIGEVARALGPELCKAIQQEVLKLGIDLAKRSAEKALGLTEKNGKIEKDKKPEGGRMRGCGFNPDFDGMVKIIDEFNTWFKSHRGLGHPTKDEVDAFLSSIKNELNNIDPKIARQFIDQVKKHYINPHPDGYIGMGIKRKYIRKPKPIGSDPNTYTPNLPVPGVMPGEKYDLNKFENQDKLNEMGGRRKQLPHSGEKRNKARGAIVSEVMKKHKLSLPMASKFVKEHGLY